jgi:3',5'-cyclic AMP phosphodiesterase CpdA
MAFLLHISDLHLSTGSDEDELGDYSKSEAIPAEERQTRRHMLESTLDAIRRYLGQRDIPLDALIVTGDLTYRNSASGFELLDAALGRLQGALPPKDRIVIVPGNHDVQWHTSPSTPERYGNFIRYVRNSGYRTPLLDGVDFSPSSQTTPVTHNPVLVADDSSFVILALNSANYCGLDEPLKYVSPDRLNALLEGTENEDEQPESLLAREVQSLRTFDMARFSPGQLAHARNAMELAVAALSDSNPVRLAALHHQVMPIATTEELKPFESLTNLGEFREFLRANAVDIVLHGHKHVAAAYEDSYRIYSASSAVEFEDQPPHRVLICSAGTTGGQLAVGTELAKLIEIDAHLPTLRRTRVSSLPAVSGGSSITRPAVRTSEHLVARRVEPDKIPKLQGPTAAAVHELLLEWFDRHPGQTATNLVCHIEDGKSALMLPPTYPEIPGHEYEREAWFEEIRLWWQKDHKGGGEPFTHGERIKAYAGTDQLASCADALVAKLSSSRGVISLLIPREDRPGQASIEFPAFCLLQFHVVDDQLSAVAYFRKQEMRYWWPINVAEIAQLQEELRDQLRERGVDLTEGPITTVSAMAIVGESVPKVSVPLIDRMAEDGEGTIWLMALALFDRQLPNRTAQKALWYRLMDDWRPPDRQSTDGVPIPHLGLKRLMAAVDTLNQAYTSPTALRVQELLERMDYRNEQYRQLEDLDKGRPQRYISWRDKIRQLMTELFERVDDLIPNPDTRTPK